jgi:hypothetical protein
MLRIVTVYLVVAIVEIALHSYAGMGRTAAARQLYNFYLSRDRDNNKAYVAGVVDLIIPAITLGIAAGVLCATWEPRRLVIMVFLLCLGIVALFPIYGICYSNGGLRSLAAANASAVTSDDLFKVFAKALALCGVFAYGARILAMHFRA